MKVIVEIPEVHKNIVTVEVSNDATREEICKAANEVWEYGELDCIELEFSHILDDEQYVIRDENGKFFGDAHFGQSENVS